jgi:D-glycero-alpha-D-manno-heptose 1-phosphate guanylyltransferase
MITEAIILAGGFGTRLQKVVSNVPKPMAEINGEPFLNYIFYKLKKEGIKTVVLSVGYLSQHIINYYKEEFAGIKIYYSIENTPLGTGGGIKLALDFCKQNEILVLNGDSFFNVSIQELYSKHFANISVCSLALRVVENSERYGSVEINEHNRIVDFKEKNSEPNKKENQKKINGGVYILNKKHFIENSPSGNFSIEQNYFQALHKTEKFYGFPFHNYFIDIGIPESYNQANSDFKKFENLP